MKSIKLSNEEALIHGFTHKWILSFADGDFSTADTTQTYTLVTLAVGEIVKNAAYKVVTTLDGGATSTGTIVMGITGTTNAFITIAVVHEDGTEVLYGTGNGASFNQGGGYVAVAAIAVLLTLVATGANVSVLTQGELHIYAQIGDLKKI